MNTELPLTPETLTTRIQEITDTLVKSFYKLTQLEKAKLRKELQALKAQLSQEVDDGQ